MRIVALVPGGIGDQILFFPTLDDLKRYYPNSQVDVVVEPRTKAAYRVSKSVNEVLTFDFKDRNSLADWANLVGIIRDREYDVAIAVGQSWVINLVLWLTGIPTRIGYQGKGNAFLTNKVPLKTQQYPATVYHDLLQGFGIDSACPELTINLPKPDIDWANKEQQRLGVKETGYILIYNGLSELTLRAGKEQIYPVENWQSIIQDFQHKQPDMPIVVVSNPNTPNVGILKQSVPGIKVTSPGDVGKLAAMIALANLVVCTESASMYLSIAVQTYTIALFGSSESASKLPQNEKFLAIISPTGDVKDISPKTVLEKIWGG
ncbi:glycosyltransferase family 9 protein [Iningainema tapete]|uniref:Glycosyltransferase family 9 protein n=1 Tax=Iningainema tapete BLCC-T55 TaxID=2748662 RepID=A0A8J6XZH2_9CYAN|nr:glycosyltransferase family 9 protein [Iningainema tapete]MBD2778777.1 glycosyltransferase family 9 protein [Iningainema tapete BLCC-T55]